MTPEPQSVSGSIVCPEGPSPEPTGCSTPDGPSPNVNGKTVLKDDMNNYKCNFKISFHQQWDPDRVRTLHLSQHPLGPHFMFEVRMNDVQQRPLTVHLCLRANEHVLL